MDGVGDGKVKETMKHQKSNSHGDTNAKEVENDSPCSDKKVKAGGTEDLHLFQSFMQFDDTLLYESDWLETELVGELVDLSGGTQVLESLDSKNEHEGSDVDEIEKTEILSDDDEESDDETNVCRIENFHNKRETGHEVMEKKCLTPLCSDGKGIKDYVSNSDASKDREYNAGSVWKSFTSVRTASLRSSGLVAACSMIREATGIMQNSTSGINQASQKQGNIEVIHPHPAVYGIEHDNISSLKDPTTFTASDVHEKIHMHDTESRIKNSRVRKLFFEHTPTGEMEEINKITTGKVDSPRFLSNERAVAGLSYVGLQEPGIESQANALDMVDKFLLLNDVDLSGEVDTGKSLGEKSSLIPRAKGAQSLAKRACHRSPIRNAGVYDWVDSREDETGGDFFSKRKDLLLADIQFRNVKHLAFGRTENPVGRCRESGQERGTEIHQKKMGLTCPDTKSILQSSIESESMQVTETITRKNLSTELPEQSNADDSGEQLDTVALGSSSQGTDDIGVNTQLAAEALESLVCGPPANHDFADKLPIKQQAKGGSKSGAMKNKGGKKHVSVKRGRISDSNGTMRKSMHKKMLLSNSCEGNSISEKHLTSTGTRMLRKESPVKTRAMKKKQKYEEHFNTRKSAGGNEYSVEKSSRYVKRRQSRGALTETCIEVDKCHTTLISDKQLSFSKSSFKEELLHNIVVPIAHRTRRSMMNSLKRTNIPSNDRMQGKTYSRDNGILQNEGGVNWINDAPGPSKTIQSSSKFGPNQISKIGKDEHQLQDRVIEGGLQDERSQIGYQKKDASSHTKKRRTRTVSDIIHNTTNSSVPSDALNGVGEANAQISTREKRLKTNPTSTFLSFNTVKRKTRSATRSNLPSLHLSMAVLPKPDVTSCSPNPATAADSFASEPCGPSMDQMTTGRREPIVYGIRTRSSGISDPFMPSDKRSTEVLIRDKIRKPGTVDAAVNCLMDAKNDEAPTEQLILPTSGVPTGSGSEGGADPSTSPVQGSPKKKGPCEGTITLSPVCTGNDPEKLPGKRYLRRSSLMRELVRLDATEAKQTTALKDTRRRRDMASICVLFSHHLGEDIIKHQKKILSRLGGSIASSSSDATHFVADKFVRTRNMLEALALGKPVVTHFWLESCGQASCFIDEKNYILRDLKKEKEIGFSMPVSLARAYQRPLLQGKRVYITANVKPDRELVASLVKAVHGQAIERIGRFTVKGDRIPDDLLVISCEEDYSLCTPLLENGAEIYTSELLLNGIVIQKLEYERHHLFLDHVKRTRSTVWLRKEAGTQFIPVTRRR